jgi:hypothetical protein
MILSIYGQFFYLELKVCVVEIFAHFGYGKIACVSISTILDSTFSLFSRSRTFDETKKYYYLFNGLSVCN